MSAKEFAVAGWCFLLIAGLTRAQAATAQTPTSPLAAIRVSESTRFSSEQVAAASGLQIGRPVTRDDFQAAADRLAQLGAFSNVQYRFSSRENGVVLEFQLTDSPTVPAAFDNFPWFTDAEITDALRKDVPLFDGSVPEQGSLLDAIDRSLEKLLETRGVHASVEHGLFNSPGSGQKVQQFRITGAALKVGEVQFNDALAKNDRGLKERLADLVGRPFSREAIELFEFEQVRPVYLAHSFLRMKFDNPQARFSGNPNAPLPDSVLVIINVIPGRAYTWNGVQWSGYSALHSFELDDLVQKAGLKKGESADGMKILALWNHVNEEYNSRGYLDVKVEPVPQFDDSTGRASYTVHISEGSQYRMGNLVLTGLSVEGERRIRQAWRIAPGTAFDSSFYEEFVARGIREALGDLPFHYDQVGRWLQKNPQAGTVDVLLDFQ